MNELDIQRELCHEVNDLGGYGFKCSNRFLIGVVDLSWQLPSLPHLFIEIKYAPKFVHTDRAHLDITTHQKRFIDRNNAAGGHAGWLLVVSVSRGRGEYAMQCGRDVPNDRTLRADSHWIYKERGKPWPVSQIALRIMSMKAPQPLPATLQPPS